MVPCSRASPRFTPCESKGVPSQVWSRPDSPHLGGNWRGSQNTQSAGPPPSFTPPGISCCPMHSFTASHLHFFFRWPDTHTEKEKVVPQKTEAGFEGWEAYLGCTMNLWSSCLQERKERVQRVELEHMLLLKPPGKQPLLPLLWGMQMPESLLGKLLLGLPLHFRNPSCGLLAQTHQ